MKSDMKKILMTVVMAAALVLPAMAQSYGSQSSTDRQQSVAAPAAGFRSTSTMQGSGSTYTPNPGLNSNGTAAAPAAAKAPGGPHRAPDPISGDSVLEQYINDKLIDDVFDTPIGDALVPLSLMALAFGAVVAVRRRKAA